MFPVFGKYRFWAENRSACWRTLAKNGFSGRLKDRVSAEQLITANPSEAPVTGAVVSPDGKLLLDAFMTRLPRWRYRDITKCNLAYLATLQIDRSG